jgi:transcription-repair coupling factor (superfamily II helicase)
MPEPQEGSLPPLLRYAGLSGSRLGYALFQLALGNALPLASDRALFDSRIRLGSARAAGAELARTVVVLVPDQAQGEELAATLRFFIEDEEEARPSVHTFFGWELLPFDSLSPAEVVSGARLSALFHLLRGSPGVVVTTPEALMQRVLPARLFQSALLPLKNGDEVNRETLVAALDARGYVRRSLVEEAGQMSVRGAVVDLFSPNYRAPVRIEFFGDRIEALRFFDRGTQRSRSQTDLIEIIPAKEALFPWFLRPDSGMERELLLALGRVRDRANELELPLRAVEPIEDVFRTGATWAGIEHLQPLFLPPLDSFWEYLPTDAFFAVSDKIGIDRSIDAFSEIISERAERAAAEGILFPPPAELFDTAKDVQTELAERLTHSFDSLPFLTHGAESFQASDGAAGEAAPAVALFGNGELRQALSAARHSELPFRPLADALRNALALGIRIAYTVDSPARRRRITEILAGYDLPVTGFPVSFAHWRSDPERSRAIALLEGYCTEGFSSPSEGIWLLADTEIFTEAAVRKRRAANERTRRFLGSLNQISENDFIVHADHGVGIYRGLKQIAVAGRAGDFLTLEYAEGAKLFVPVENIGKIEKYLGGEGVTPELSKLGGKVWAKTKQKVKDRVAELAGHLITLYAEREIAERPPFNEADADDLRFASEFPFQETPDQEKAIEAVLADLARPNPMDRLVCGDVGYGKTEVALRAAFKVMNAGKQVAFLVPTTILADQHFATVKERFKEFPLSVACVSRFFSPQENKDTLAKVASGEMDIVVGTHRLLQKDVLFQNLGLVIIDEEHKFGVKDKERLTNLRKNADVLTLTATPIPRTLHMSLLDIRDLSIIETPPVDRQVIRTYVAPYQDGIVREAVLRELGRVGHFFLIDNRFEIM